MKPKATGLEGDLAALALERARRWMATAEEALRGERFDDALYAAQMASEQAAKAVLIRHNIEYPKSHDPGPVLAELDGLPQWFKENLPRMVSILALLAKRRGQAGYGFEEGLDVSAFKEAAPGAVRDARWVLESCARLLAHARRPAHRQR